MESNLMIPNIKTNAPSAQHGRPDKLIFLNAHEGCGGLKECSGQRSLENYCFGLAGSSGFWGLDTRCVVALIQVQMTAINKYLGIDDDSHKRQTMRVEDAEEIIKKVRREAHVRLGKEDAVLTREDAYFLISDLLLEKLYANKSATRYFYGISAKTPETKPFSDLDPHIIAKFQKVLRDAHVRFKAGNGR